MKTIRRGEWRLRKWNEMRKRQPVKFYILLTLTVLLFCAAIVLYIRSDSFPKPQGIQAHGRGNGAASRSEAFAEEKDETSEVKETDGAKARTEEAGTNEDEENTADAESDGETESDAADAGGSETEENDTADAGESKTEGSDTAGDGGNVSANAGGNKNGGGASANAGGSEASGNASANGSGSGGSTSAGAEGSGVSGTQPASLGARYSISDYAPGDLIGDDVVYSLGKDSFFSQTKISDRLFERIYGKSYKEDCIVPRDDLRYVSVLYYDFRGNRKMGELICNKAISQDLVEIFRELYENEYPIEKICLVDDYDADDDRSSTDNNTSCFNYRTVVGKSTLSLHAKGLAIDINPKYNPYVRRNGEGEITECLPANGSGYTDRTQQFSYKIDEQDLCYRLFMEHGFTWGGSWTGSERDFMHFSKSEVPEQ